MENVNKPAAWLDQNDQSSIAIFTVAVGLLVQLLSGYKSIEKLDKRLTIFLGWILFLVYLLAGSLMIFKCHISGKKKLSHNQKMVLMFLNLLNETGFMAANVVFVAMVDKSYLEFASIPVLGFIVVAVLFYFELKSDQNQEPPGDNEDDESMVKICFKVANATTSTGYLVQTAVIICYIKNPDSPKDHPQYNIIMPFLTLVVGSFVRIITSSPLQFQSDLIRGFLKQIPNVMLGLQGLVAAFLSAKFVDPAKEVFAVIIPFIVKFLVNLCQKFSNKQVTEDTLTSTKREVDSMFGALAGFGMIALSAIYSVNFGSEGCDSYLTYSVFFLLLATISSLMRMAFLLRPAHMVIEYVNDALPMVQTLLGLSLLLTEISTYITII